MIDYHIKQIADALGTEERGEALIEVARNAHRAKQKLAAVLALLRHADNLGDGSDTLDEAMKLIEATP